MPTAIIAIPIVAIIIDTQTFNEICSFKKINDNETVKTLELIYAEEVGHVAFGSKWFHFLCGRHNKDPKIVFHELVSKYFKSSLKPPFNDEKRAEAGIPLDFYWPIAIS